ncbi:MAG: hypothetical protein A2Y12_14180 [Planctomycetes bacterium GWF2_42_9]|nr:MAG: hypothetical protein A2Y12_14180 [Planctomycetes bacterium GWF2_42_9]
MDKKVFLTVCVFVGLATYCSASTVSYWYLDEDSKNLRDNVGSYNLTYKAGMLDSDSKADVIRTSNIGSQTALRANAVHIPEIELSTDAWTVEGFYRSTSTLREYIASNNPGGRVSSGAWDLEVSWHVVGALTFRIQAVNGSAVIIDGSRNICDGQFHHWAVTWNPNKGSSGEISLYIDGVIDANGNGAGNQGIHTSNIFFLGGLMLTDATFSPNYGLTGKLDEVRISDRILGTNQFLNTNPVLSYWYLDDSGQSAYIDSTTRHNLINQGGTNNNSLPPSVPRGGNLISQTELKANTDHISEIDLGASPWTIEGFYRSFDNGRQFLASNNPSGIPSTGGWDFEVSYPNFANRFTFRVQKNDGTRIVISGNKEVTTGTFHHWAFTWDPPSLTDPNGIISIYVDGVLDKRSAGPGLQDCNEYNKFYLGGFMLEGGIFYDNYNTSGEIDEVRISTRVLTPGEFLRLPSDTISYWNLDEESGALYDDSFDGYNLTKQGGVLNTINTPDVPRGINLGSQTALRASTIHVQETELSIQPWTLEGFFRSTSSSRQFITSNNPGGRIKAGAWDLEVSWQVANALSFRILTKAGSTIVINGSKNICDGQFHHWAIIWEPAIGINGRVSLYVDGIADASGDGAGDQGSSPLNKLYFGGFMLENGTFSSSYGVTGELDEIRLSGYALDPSVFLIYGSSQDPGEELGPCSGERYVFGDVNYDCIVNLLDLGKLAISWLNIQYAMPYSNGDIIDDDKIDFKDFVALAANWGKEAVESPTITNIQAAYRSGQVFLTWNEVVFNTNNVRVYMLDRPITPSNLSQAQLLTDKLESHSAKDWFDDPAECPKAVGPIHGWIIEQGTNGLNPNSGLFVHTVMQGEPAETYFAVLAIGQDTSELQLGQNSLLTPISVAVAPKKAIWQLSGTQPAATGKALGLMLHSHQERPSGTFTHLAFGDATMGWREGLPIKFKVTVLTNMVLVEPYDRVWINRKLDSTETYISYNTLYKNIESWWYGTNDKIYDPVAKLTGTPTNYTERILSWILEWVAQNYQTDPQKVYAFGASMGTGVQRLAMQNPDMFASVDVLVPFVDFAYESGNESNAKRFKGCCGSVDLLCNDGMPLRDRLDLVDFVQAHTSDLPPVVIRVGRQDSSVFWRRKPDYINSMQNNRHSLIAGWDNGTHSTAMRYHVDGIPDFSNYTWFISHFALNQSFPAFTNFSMNENPGNGDNTDGDIIGFINRGLDWHDIIDTPSSYEITVTADHPDVVFPVTVDITPRRRQLFNPAPGIQVIAKNKSEAGTIIDTRYLIVDADGRITYDQFAITSGGGNTLILQLP